MRNYFLILIVLIIISCSNNQKSEVIKYEFLGEFNIKNGANAITLDSEYSNIFISVYNNSINNEFREIQKYNIQGDYIETLIDYMTNIDGNYEYYTPLDLTTDSDGNILVLVRPYYQFANNEWYQHNGFCIIVFDENGKFQKEYDFGSIEEKWFDEISFLNGFIYVTNGTTIKRINSLDDDVIDINLPVENIGSKIGYNIDDNIPVSDMAIDGEENIWLVGQSRVSEKEIGCFMVKFNLNYLTYDILYSNGSTDNFGAAFNKPGIVFDDKDNFYLATGYCQSIEMFNNKGKFEQEISIIDHQFSYPTDIKIDKDYNIYVLDSRNDRILIYGLEF